MGSPVFPPQGQSQAPLALSFSSIAPPRKTPSWAGSRLRGFTHCQNQPLLRAGRAGNSLEKLKNAKLSIGGLTGIWPGQAGPRGHSQEELPHPACVPEQQPPAPDSIPGLSFSVADFFALTPTTAQESHFLHPSPDADAVHRLRR